VRSLDVRKHTFFLDACPEREPCGGLAIFSTSLYVILSAAKNPRGCPRGSGM
jgi:hypothetical protein